MNDKTDRRMALLMQEEEIPEVVPPRSMTPEEKAAAVRSYLLTEEGKRAVQEAVDKEAGVIFQRIRRDELEAARAEVVARTAADERRARALAAQERLERAAAQAADIEARRGNSAPRARDNSDYYRQQRAEALARLNVTARPTGPLPVEFDTSDIEIHDPFAGALEDL